MSEENEAVGEVGLRSSANSAPNGRKKNNNV